MTSGILNIDKPRGVTSFSVIGRVRRLTGIRRVGHAGTLDPFAQGVLPVCLGRATRLIEYIVEQPKLYRGVVRLGITTDTYDSEGMAVATGHPGSINRQDVEGALTGFAGDIEQVPPPYSAIKRAGRPLYDYARAGETVTVQARRVKVYRVELLRFEPPRLEIEVECGGGTYIRSIAHDLGQLLGCGAHLESLTRLRSGPFELGDAFSFDDLDAAPEPDSWQALLLATDRAIESWPAAVLGEDNSLLVTHGRDISFESDPDEGRCRAYSSGGTFLGVLQKLSTNHWKAAKVLA
jgi:tRNA pseudouridine55 synthase